MPTRSSQHPDLFRMRSYLPRVIEGRKYRLPKNAQLVADLDMGSCPGGGDYRPYYLSRHLDRSWVLWLLEEDANSNRAWYRMAEGSPCRGYTAKEAAERLLNYSWEDERDSELKYEPMEALVMKEGLLTVDDIVRIAIKVWPALAQLERK